MKKIFAVCIAAWFLWGCSPSHPSIIDASISDNSPVTGQKVLLQVLSMSDNYPLSYRWYVENEETDGVLTTGESTDHFAYWTTPDVAGTYRVSCTVTDDEDKNQTHVFDVVVTARTIEPLYGPESSDHAAETVLSMEKQGDSLIGGIWISTNTGEGEIRYVTSTSDQSTSWQGAFGTIRIRIDNLSLVYTLWGTPVVGNTVSALSSSGNGILTFGTDNTLVINDLAVDYNSIPWIATDSGMYKYVLSGDTWTTIQPIKTNAFYLSQHNLYAATADGVYVLEFPYYSAAEPLASAHPGESFAVLEVIGDDKTTLEEEPADTTTVWHVTDNKLYSNKNGTEVEIPSPPGDEVPHTLDVDTNGYIWCGQYRWDGSIWWTPPGMESREIRKVAASTEGRIYFLTSSGTLLRW